MITVLKYLAWQEYYFGRNLQIPQNKNKSSLFATMRKDSNVIEDL